MNFNDVFIKAIHEVALDQGYASFDELVEFNFLMSINLIIKVMRIRSNFSGGKHIYMILLSVVLLISGACDKDDDDDDDPKSAQDVVFYAMLSGDYEVPANNSEATGTATLTFSQETKIFTIVVNFSGVTATAAHIHKAAQGVSGGVAFPLTTTSPISYTSQPLTEDQEHDLFDNLYYVNIHSSAYPDGEIRGQLVEQ